MGLFGPFTYTNEEGDTFWLHKSENGDRTLYYFSQNPDGALGSKPDGYVVRENPNSQMPYLEKGQESIVDTILGFLGM